MVTLEHTLNGHTKRVTVTRGDAGWEVREEHDSHVVRQVTYRDWHRVERAMQTFERREGDALHSTNR
jgi:hypothetical protein